MGTRDTSHAWFSDEVYTLTLNASPQEWHGGDDRYIVASLLQQDNTVLWSESVLMPKYDAFGRNPWTEAQTFTFEIPASEFTTGTEGEFLSVRIAHSGQRGIYFDNVMLTFAGDVIPEPASLSLLGLGALLALRRRRSR